jgi:hypothetical protein
MSNGTSFPVLRSCLAAEFSDLNDEQLDAVVAEIFGAEATAEDIESFWSDLGRGLSQAGKSVATALPSIAQGAATGAGFGGPIGALVGAVAGGAGGILSQSRNKTLRGIGSAVGGIGQVASTIRGGGIGNLANIALGGLAKAAPGGAGGPLGALAGGLARAIPGAAGGSANALMGLLSRPETMQAMMSSTLGAAGRSRVMVGNQPVGVQSIMSAIGNLAGRAASEAAADTSEGLPEFFLGAEGEPEIDPADADQRTDALLALFALTLPRLLAGQRDKENDESDESDDRENGEWDEAFPEYTDADAENDEWILAAADFDIEVEELNG